MMSEEKSIIVNKLWNEYQPYIRRLCNFKLRSLPEQTDDCIQEVFLELLKSFEKGVIPEYPKAWLTKVASNKIKDIYEKAAKNTVRLTSLEDELSDFSYPDNTFEEAFPVDDEKIFKLKKKITAMLKEDERRLLTDRYSMKKSVSQIAKEYGTTENNIYQKIFRLKVKTKMLIEKELTGQK